MLTPLRIAWNNLLDLAAAVVTASTEAAAFPATQIQTAFRALRWRSTVITSSWIKADFAAAMDWNTVILWDHNLTTSATVTVEGSADGSAWTTVMVGVPTVASQLVVDCGEQLYRYVRMTIADATNPAAYFEVGKVFVGTYLEAQYHDNYGRAVTPVSRSVRTETPNGVTHTLVRPQYKRVSVAFERITPEMRDDFLAFVESVDIWMQFWLMLNVDTAIDTSTYYVTLDQGLAAFAEIDCEQYNFALSFSEVT